MYTKMGTYVINHVQDAWQVRAHFTMDRACSASGACMLVSDPSRNEFIAIAQALRKHVV